MTAILLGYEDPGSASDFLVRACGFTEDLRVVDDEGAVTRVHVRLGDTVLLLDRPGAHGVLSPRRAGGVTHLVVISVGDVAAHHERCSAAGAKPGPIADQPWGRDYELVDPEAYRFSFVE